VVTKAKKNHNLVAAAQPADDIHTNGFAQRSPDRRAHSAQILPTLSVKLVGRIMALLPKQNQPVVLMQQALAAITSEAIIA
jgi:hypothetical protein